MGEITMNEYKTNIKNKAQNIVNNFLSEWPSGSKIYNGKDGQIRYLIDGMSLIKAQSEYNMDKKMNDIVYSILYNSFNLSTQHTDIVKVSMQSDSNTSVVAGSVYENNSMFINKYTTYLVNGYVVNCEVIQRNYINYLQISLHINNIEDLTNITFLANQNIINAMFKNNNILDVSVVNRDIYNTSATCEYINVNIFDYCFYNDQGYMFNVKNINTKGITNNLTLQIPLSYYINVGPKDIVCNTIFLENKFQHTVILEISQPGEYVIDFNHNYEMININNITNENNISIPNASQDINGWYITYKNHQWYLNINMSNIVVYVNMICRHKSIYTEHLVPSEYMPITITNTYMVPNLNLVNIQYISKLILLIQSFASNNLNAIFELIKLYDSYNFLQYQIKSANMITLKYINQEPYLQQGLSVEINSNINDTAFKQGILKEIDKYANIVSVLWN